ncbi:hypothetical protein IWQ57_003547, partial [Coemansia nantahalensis]
QMSQIYPAALSHFAVFCPALGPEEDNTHEQLLFYAAAGLPAFYPCTANDYFARTTHPRRRQSGGGGGGGTETAGRSPTRARATATTTAAAAQERVVSLDTKLREIGLGAALVAFAGSFAADGRRDGFHTVRSEKRRTVVFEPEPGVLMQLAVVLPRRARPLGKEKDTYSVEFLAGALDDRALRAWVAQEYWAFRTLFGPIGVALRGGAAGRRRVQRQLEAFFGRTLWAWDRRWDPACGDELDLLCALRPLPLLPVGPISLGGFDEFWRDLAALAVDTGGRPLVGAAVVLWRGVEAVWASWLPDAHGRPATPDPADEDRAHVLRALVAWSRAVYAPAFEAVVAAAADSSSSSGERLTGARRQARAPVAVAQPPPLPPRPQAESLARVPAPRRDRGVEAGGWTLPGTGWLRSWRDSGATPPPQPAHTESGGGGEEEDSGSDASGQAAAATPAGVVLGGLSQVLSRAVDALVEPRAPTPPEVDPAFASDDHRAGAASETVAGRQLTPGQLAAAEQYTLSAADVEAAHGAGGTFARDSDGESLQSVGSLASVQTARTTAAASVALSRHAGVGRTRSSTLQHGGPFASSLAAVPALPPAWPPGAMHRRGPGYSRAPSIASNATFGTVDSMQLRDDTRVSARSWWPSSWSWGAAATPPLAQQAALSLDADALTAGGHYDAGGAEDDGLDPSGIDPTSTFLCTGDLPFPGLDAEQPRRPVAAESPRSSTDGGSGGSGALETISQLGQAMDEDIPAAYEHGVGVDCSRGVVLSPRGLPGMQYDSRLLRLLFPPGAGSPTAGVPAEHQLFVGSGAGASSSNRTLAYKYGDLLFLVFGAPVAGEHGDGDDIEKTEAAQGGETLPQTRVPRGRRARARGARARAAPPSDGRQQQQRFDGVAAQAAEQAVLRYAESLQTATRRDMGELAQQQQREVQLSQQRRIPPYVLREGGGPLAALVRSNWRAQERVPVNRSFAGYAGTTASDPLPPAGARGRAQADAGPVPAAVRHALAVVDAEVGRAGDAAAVCVRMQDKGWVAGSAAPAGDRCYCLVDQPKATLADAQRLLDRIARRPPAPQHSGLASPT